MISNCSIVNFFLNDIIYEYLMNLSIIINIESYFMIVVEFFDFDNLIIKFIEILFYNDFDEF